MGEQPESFLGTSIGLINGLIDLQWSFLRLHWERLPAA